MSRIIQGNFTADEAERAEQMKQARFASAARPDIVEVRANNISLAMRENADGGYTIVVTQIDPVEAMFKKTYDLRLAIATFSELQTHVEAGDRTYSEIAMMVSQKLNR